ncbi:cupin domain-containing protein [Actinomycetospora aeridis]|uniref:Cupin n=1 Tax=Actinomycetospora aeridis TaxID=3129231 RepID=A0ABU8NC15_9PSEU
MSTTAPEPVSITDDGLDVDPVASHLVVGPDDGYGGVSLVRMALPSRASTGPVRYEDADRLVIVLEGCVRIEVDGRPAVTLGAHEVLHVPREAWHCAEALRGAAELLVLGTDGADGAGQR